VLIGSHVGVEDPLAAAEAEGADVVQIFLGNPQSWKKPKPREDAQTLKASSMPLYVHAPYLINVASANNRVRIPSRKILQDTCDAASEINATAVIVHGGHADDNDMEAGFERWVKALASLETDVALYLENTAGGDGAMAWMKRLREAPTRSGRPKPRQASSRAMQVMLCSGVLPKPMPGSSTMRSRSIPARSARAIFFI